MISISSTCFLLSSTLVLVVAVIYFNVVTGTIFTIILLIWLWFTLLFLLLFFFLITFFSFTLTRQLACARVTKSVGNKKKKKRINVNNNNKKNNDQSFYTGVYTTIMCVVCVCVCVFVCTRCRPTFLARYNWNLSFPKCARSAGRCPPPGATHFPKTIRCDTGVYGFVRFRRLTSSWV
jgi:energy-coupling factor transporter transmembrane protein EcfT